MQIKCKVNHYHNNNKRNSEDHREKSIRQKRESIRGKITAVEVGFKTIARWWGDTINIYITDIRNKRDDIIIHSIFVYKMVKKQNRT